MLSISMFYGIIIRMYVDDDNRHNLPHIHVFYNEFSAVFDLTNGNVIDGKFPPKQTNLVQSWIWLRHDELLANWKIATSGEQPYKIAPLV